MLKILEWDSAFFGTTVGSLEWPYAPNSLEIEKFINNHHPSLIQSLCPVNDVNYIHYLEVIGFRLADVKITFKTDLKGTYMKSEYVRKAKIKDFTSLHSMMDNLFEDSRYYGYEEVFKHSQANELYRTWIERSIKGQLDSYCLVYELANRIAGFITVKENGREKASIGLIGTHPAFRKMGIATTLLNDAMQRLQEKEVHLLNVSTQGKNNIAQNLYIANGFQMESISLWYYLVNNSEILK
ncbi:GNAT family N-acetyltransferase [Paenibacillus wulumuqiensis]|uniref:GNAT family N-acetyltransferase n=1 Tax=Paenibacillus wulumuqiensis TaxID=1567107 RepID=UPI0006194BBD|nr:GNAT family N-acetyltransferase [Paenibacillus wulumuqiensis]